MTRESGIVMAGGDDRRERFNEYMEDELPGEVQPEEVQPGGNEVPDCDYSRTSPEEETEVGQGVQQQQIGDIQPGDRDEGMDMEEYPPGGRIGARLRGSWENSEVIAFHKVLDCSSCLRSPTNRHAVVRSIRLFICSADWKAPPTTFMARKQRTAKKNTLFFHHEGIYIFYLARIWHGCLSLGFH